MAGFKCHCSPTTDTLYSIESLTKAFSAAGIAKLIDDNKQVDWDTHIEDILTNFNPSDPRLQRAISISDFLSHRTGLLGDLSFAIQDNSEILLPP